MSDNLYLKRDLTDYAVDVGDEEGRYGRNSYLEAVLPDEAEIEVYSTGGYQGTQGYAITLDGYYWIIKEAYGSCSYCDAFLNAQQSADQTAVEYIHSMMRNSYCFESLDDALQFLQEKDDPYEYYRWPRIASEVAENLKDLHY